SSWFHLSPEYVSHVTLFVAYVPVPLRARCGLRAASLAAQARSPCRRCGKTTRRANHQTLSSPPAKNFPLCPSAKSSLQARAIPPRSEGRFAIVTNVGCGMRWTRQRRQTSDAGRGRRSRVVLTPRRWRQLGDDAFASHRGWWQESPVTRESAKETVKTIGERECRGL